MKKVIRLTESDLVRIVNRIVNEQKSNLPIKITCRDYDKIKTYCESLKPSPNEVKSLIEKNRDRANKLLLEKINNFSKEIINMGGEDGKKIAEKFSSAIETSKINMFNYLSKYYPQCIYASAGLNRPIDLSQIVLGISDILYKEFIKTWNESAIEKNLVKFLITKKNINQIQSNDKNIWQECVSKIESFCEFYFLDSGYDIVNNFYTNKIGSTKCNEIIVIEDKGCNKLPKEKQYVPQKTYKLGYPVSSGDGTKLASITYLPKLKEFLNNMV